MVKVEYLIPEGFTGGVILIFNQPDGITPETDKDGTIIFRVPKDGLIKIKSPLERNAYEFKYFYINEKGERTPIEYLYPKNYVKNPGDTVSRNIDEVSEDESNNKIFASDHETSNFSISGEKVYVYSFIIEKPVNALKTFLDTSHKVFDIQREFLKSNKSTAGRPQTSNE